MVRRPSDGLLADGTLLRQFAEQSDETAFAQLVSRHGGLVWGVCQRVLGQAADTEDAFQATFLVLARKARAIARKDSLRSWLHGVAYRVACNAKRASAVRRQRESCVPVRESADETEELTWKEVRQVLDEELLRLPEKYRLPLLWCYLEGKTQDETARQLGWDLGVFRGRLDRGRERLRQRLVRRGISLGSVLAATLAAQCVAQAAVPARLVANTVQAASLCAAGKAVGAVSTPVTALVEGVLRTMFLTKIKWAALTFSVLVVGAGLVAQQVVATKRPDAQQAVVLNQPAAEQPPARQVTRTDFYGDPLPPNALVRLGTVRLRQGGSSTFVTYSPDGRLLASWDGHNYIGIRLWDARTGAPQLKATLMGDAVTFSPDGKLLAAHQKSEVVLWQTDTGREVRRLATTDRSKTNRITTLAFSPDGKTLAAGGGPELWLWETATGKEIHRIPVKGVSIVAFEGDGRTLLSVGQADGVRWWDLQTGKQRRQVVPTNWQWQFGFGGPQVALSPNRQFLAWAKPGLPFVVRRWDLAVNKELKPLQLPNGLQAVAFSPDGKMLATSGWDRSARCKIRFWDMASGQEVRQARETVNPYTFSLAFSPEGKTLASAGNESAIRLWEVASGKEVVPAEGHLGGVSRFAFLGDGKQAITAGYDGSLRVWDATTGKPLDYPTLTQQLEGRVGEFAVSSNGQTLALWMSGNVFRLLDAGTGKEIRRWKGHPSGDLPQERLATRRVGRASRLAFSPDGKYLAAGSHDGTVPVWETATGKEHRLLPIAKTYIDALALSADGHYLATGCGGTVLLSDATSGKQLRSWTVGGLVQGLAFSPDGKNLGAAAGRELHLWQLATGERRFHIKEKQEVSSVAFSPDGRSMAAWSGDTLRLWETATNAERQRFIDPNGGDSSVTFSPDGKRLATISREGTVLIWGLARRGVSEMTQMDLQRSWIALAGADAEKAYDAISNLAETPKQAVPFLQKQLRSAPPSDPQEVAQLIADLDSQQFAVRQKATEELEKIGEGAVPALRKALSGKPSLELRQRVEQLLEKATGLTAERLRELRAIEALEWMATPEAKQLLEKVAQGTGWAKRSREEAQAALTRLHKRNTAK